MSIASTFEKPSLEAAVDAFLTSADLSPSSVRVYRQALEQLARQLDGPVSFELINAERLEHAAVAAWRHLGAATWNRNIAILGSFLRWSSRDDELPSKVRRRLARRREPADRTRAIDYAALERLFTRDRVPLQKTLWRLPYETAGRVGEILALDVEDLDLANKRARVRSKGGDLEFVYFQSGSARLLPRLLTGRARGPVFQTDRRSEATRPICRPPTAGRLT